MTTHNGIYLAHQATVKHSQHRDVHLGRLVHGYRPVCPCGWRGALTADEPAAEREAIRHGATR